MYDFIIVGAGMVGLSTAYKLNRAYPDLDILVLEKEDRVAAHQTGRNSGVVHSGIYYEPDSYKARNCVDGRHQLERFCREYEVPYEQCGKVIVATDEEELPRLQNIYERGRINGIEGIRPVDRQGLQEIEPYVIGIRAIHVPCSGIVDFAAMCEQLEELLRKGGVSFEFEQPVRKIEHINKDLRISTDSDRFTSRYLVNCAGLYCDHVAQMAGYQPDVQIVPFRGEYYELKPEAEHKVRGLIYPLPNPEFPFLGVHFTRVATGGVECGPNAVFAFKREGYERLSFDFEDTIETVNFPGFWRLAGAHWRMGLDEYYRSFSKKAFVRNLQQLIPSIRAEELEEAPSGVRAMALTPEGDIVDDFNFVTSRNEIHVLNAPSPAATAGLAIGDEIVRKAEQAFEL